MSAPAIPPAARASCLAAVLACAVLACGGLDGTHTITVVPDYAQFVGTASAPGPDGALQAKCGSSACHDKPGRPLRILDTRITGDEGARQNFGAVIGLQPELTSQVVAEGGADPGRLLLLRKGRATEAHKGGADSKIGDPFDRCLTTWLAGATDHGACADAVTPPDAGAP